MLDVHGLRVFQAVADKLSFTRAAETLAMTQSAVSHHIAKLERELNLELIERRGRSIVLTGAGNALLRESNRILREVTDLPQLVRAAATPDHGHLRIGASATACQYLLPDTLRELRECFPKFTLSIDPGDSPAVAEWVQNDHVDVGIMILSDTKSRLRIFPLFDDELGLVLNPLHPLADGKRIKAADLANERFVLYSRFSATYRLVERHFIRLKLALNDAIELGSMEAIKALVKLGLGISVLAKWVVQPQLDDGSLIWQPLPGPRLHRTWGIAMRTDNQPTLVERTFIELCRAASRKVTQTAGH